MPFATRGGMMRWVAIVGRVFRNLIFPPRCRICGVLLPWDNGGRRETYDAHGPAASFHKAFTPVMCALCRLGAEEPSGQRCRACGIPLVGNVMAMQLCGPCMDPRLPLRQVTAVYLHDGGPAKAVRALKYRNKRALAPSMGRLLFARATQVHLDPDEGRWDVDLVVPVPLHGKRLRKRGFNQSSLLLAGFEKELGLAVEHGLLRRRRNTPPQAGLSRKGRLKNVKGAFELAPGFDVAGRRILLVDDVLTTGSTLVACAALLKRRGAAEVSALVFSRRDATASA